MARIFSFRDPINVSRGARVGTTVNEPGGDAGSTPTTTRPASDSKLVQAAQKVGGDAFPVEVSVATFAGGAVGLFFGGWLWGALGAVGSNLAGRLGASAYCKNAPNPTGYAAGKCGGGK